MMSMDRLGDITGRSRLVRCGHSSQTIAGLLGREGIRETSLALHEQLQISRLSTDLAIILQ
jgi:hypothetical protein